MSQTIIFHHAPMSCGNIVSWMLEELNVPYTAKPMSLEGGDHKQGVLGDQSDGQGAGDRAQRHRRDRGGGHLRLPGGRVSGGQAGAPNR